VAKAHRATSSVSSGLASPLEAARRPGHRLRRLAAGLWPAFCPAALALLVGARAGHFAMSPLPAPLERVVGETLRFEFLAALSAFLVSGLLWVGIAACLLLLILRSRWCLTWTGTGWTLRPWLSSALWIGLVVLNFFLDLNADLGRLFASTLPLVWLAFVPSLRTPRAGRLVGLTSALVLTAWLAWAPTPAARVFGVPWILAGATAACLGPRLFAARDVIGVLLAFAAALQLYGVLPGAIPQALLAHGGTVLGEGRVYSFCEVPQRGTILAAVTACEGADVESCRQDHLVAYDRKDLQHPRTLSLFDESFYGRMLHLSCTGEQVRVGMSFTVIDGEPFAENVMAFDLDRPEQRTKRLLSELTGHRMLNDPEAATIYYVSEYSDRIVFERTQPAHGQRGVFRIGVREGADLAPNPLSPGSLQTEIDARSDRRHSLYFAEWIAGWRIFEVDRDTLRTRSTFAVYNGGTHSLAVDEELGRVIASGLWGIEVIDLHEGRVVARWRTHLGPRLPVIDTRRNLVFVTTTFGPDLWVFDRLSMRPLGRVPIGVGARNALLSRDGALFFASNGQQHFYWDAAALARRFGR
jgi:hypothetical protein